MFLSQPSAQVMILTGQNTSLPIHTTVVQEASSVIFTLDTATTYNKWVLGMLDVDMEGNVRLTEGWEEIFWKQTKKLKYKGNHFLLSKCNVKVIQFLQLTSCWIVAT